MLIGIKGGVVGAMEKGLLYLEGAVLSSMVVYSYRPDPE